MENKAEELSIMEKKMKSINDILPLELIQKILLRIPVKHLGRLKCVSKLWHTLISDPDFAESHLHLSLAPTHAFLYKKDSTEAYLVHPEEIFNGDNYEAKEVSFPFKQKQPLEFRFMGSCRGFVLLSRPPNFFVWNPLTGFSKTVPYPSKDRYFHFPSDASLYGFGYDASRDDYLIVVAWFYGDGQHLDFLSLTTNSWIHLHSALPTPLGLLRCRSRGLFFNGSIHWFSRSFREHYRKGLLVFDLKQRSFSRMSLPEQLIALNSHNFVERKTEIWVMKEYKVNSSWTLYEVPYLLFKPLCLSNPSDIIALESILKSGSLKFAKYNIREELLQHFICPSRMGDYTYDIEDYGVYTESLLTLPVP